MVKQSVRSVRDKFNNNIAIRGASLKSAITAGLAHGLEFFGGPRRITKYPQIRIAVRLIVAALFGIFVATFVHWMTAENSRESKSYSLISPSELALSDVTLSQPPSHSLGAWEVKG